MPDTYSTISQLPDLGSVEGTDRLVLDRLGGAVTAGAFVVGQAYQIVTVGTTSFTTIGAASNTVGGYFVASGAGSGTGTAAPINTGDAALSAVATFAVAAHEAAADPHPTYSTAAETAAAVAAHEAAADPHPTYSTAAETAAAVAAHVAAIDHDVATLVRKLVRNNSGASIPKGSAVYQTGSSGTTLTVALADASVEATASQTLGLTQEAIANNSTGYVVAVGQLDGVNTSALTEGQIVWLSETAGALTTTKPTPPAHGVVCGYCVKQSSGTSGILYVKVDNGLELNELHDVLVSGATADQFLRLAADGLWKPRTLVPSDISTSTTAGRALLTAADATAQRNSLELGTLATQSGTVPSGAIVGTTDTQTLTNKTLGNLQETVFTITDAAAFVIDPGNGPFQTVTLGANRTPVVVNFATGKSVNLKVSLNSFTLSFAGISAVWISFVPGSSGTAPSLGAAGFAHLEFWQVGSVLHGQLVGYSAT